MRSSLKFERDFSRKRKAELAMAKPHGSPALENFEELAKVLADNFKANSSLELPASQVIVVLGSSASDNTPLPEWSEELKGKILEEVRRIIDEGSFLEEICRVFSNDLGYHLYSREIDRAVLLKELRVEQISNVACQMLGDADKKVRKLISEQYSALGDHSSGPPPHLTYELLSHLIKHGFVNHVVTMNFDEMLDTALENELGSRGFKRFITGHEPLDVHETGMPKLFKVHGTVSSPESLRFSYTEVSVLTPAQARHLNALLEDASVADCSCLSLVSFGYSWQDPDLAHWVLAHLDRFRSIFIVRRKNEMPTIFERQLDKAKASKTTRSRFKVISLSDLCGTQGSVLPSSSFWWCLIDEAFARLDGEPLIPFSRHLLLGHLLEKADTLPTRVRLEILLHLLKSKGMINTFGASDSPRIRSYFAKLRGVNRGNVTVENFLARLNLDSLMQISPEPEARDTFFAQATSVEALVENVSRGFFNENKKEFIERPVLDNGTLTMKQVSTIDFVREEAGKIAEAPEVEISREVNFRLDFVFSHPRPILSFPQFASTIRKVLNLQWTHLLAIVESKRWLTYSWMREIFRNASSRRILMILPSLEGLRGWHVGRDLLEKEAGIDVGAEFLELRIPWWRHNRHLFLPVHCDGKGAHLGQGVYFIREHKSPAVAPVLLTEPRDQAKLLATFMNYSRRSRTRHEGFSEALSGLVDCLLARNGIDTAMLGMVQKAYAALSDPRELGERR